MPSLICISPLYRSEYAPLILTVFPWSSVVMRSTWSPQSIRVISPVLSLSVVSRPRLSSPLLLVNVKKSSTVESWALSWTLLMSSTIFSISRLVSGDSISRTLWSLA